MRKLLAAVAFLAAAVPVIRADDKDDAAKKLNGTYQVVAVMIGGKPDDKKKDEVESFVIKDGTLTIKSGTKEEVAKFTVDPSKKPAHIDITPSNEKVVVKGVYEAKESDKGLELSIAFTKDDGERPKDLKGEGKDEILIKLLRKKEK